MNEKKFNVPKSTKEVRFNPDYTTSPFMEWSAEESMKIGKELRLLNDLLSKLETTLRRVEEGKRRTGDLATLIEVLEDLNSTLPIQVRSDVSKLSEDDRDIIFKLRTLLRNFKGQPNLLQIKNLTLIEMEKNIVALN